MGKKMAESSENTTANPVKRGVLVAIATYKRFLSPVMGQHCRFYPRCSDYAHHAITKHGLWKGGRLAAWRILRCQPFAKGGIDEVP